MRLSNECQGAIMIVFKQNRPFTIGAALMLSIIGLGIGQAVLQNKADAQRAEAQGYVLNAAEGEHLILRGGNLHQDGPKQRLQQSGRGDPADTGRWTHSGPSARPNG